jgi:hypothetical protein
MNVQACSNARGGTRTNVNVCEDGTGWARKVEVCVCVSGWVRIRCRRRKRTAIGQLLLGVKGLECVRDGATAYLVSIDIGFILEKGPTRCLAVY